MRYWFMRHIGKSEGDDRKREVEIRYNNESPRGRQEIDNSIGPSQKPDSSEIFRSWWNKYRKL